ncbi:aspartic peptidase domain-containing protein [Mycena olivaceomarginata]|nr:aspartic peptidase domain-containing protein [Mycena olivaceomarginata]
MAGLVRLWKFLVMVPSSPTLSLSVEPGSPASPLVSQNIQWFEGTDGIVGFGPVDLTEDTVSGVSTVPTFMQNLVSQGVISENILGVSFAPLSGSDEEDTNGELTFGGVDDSKFTGSITYTTAVAPWWGVSVSKFAFGSTSLGTTTASRIVDTGTTLLYVPTTIYTKFLSTSGGKLDNNSGLVKFTTKPTSNFSFVVGGTTFSLTPTQYLVPTAQYSNWGISGSGFYTYIADGGSEAPNTILGMTFLENFYSVYDVANNRVALAPASKISIESLVELERARLPTGEAKQPLKAQKSIARRSSELTGEYSNTKPVD